MKLPRLLATFVLGGLLSLGTNAAEFEGTLQWSFSAEVTDPDLKARIAEVKRQLADPAKLAQMKAMLENPQMQAALQQNPQMRAAIEAQIRLAEEAAAGKGGGDLLGTVLPKSATLRTKAGRSHLSVEGGAMPLEVISLRQPQASYWLDRESGTFARLAQAAPSAAEARSSDFKITKTGNTAKVLGYPCEEHLVEISHEGRTIRNTLWVTDAIEGLDAKALARTQIGGRDAAYLAQVEGVPLKMEMVLPQMRLLMQASAVSAGPVPESLFVVPADFKERPSPFAPAAVPASVAPAAVSATP